MKIKDKHIIIGFTLLICVSTSSLFYLPTSNIQSEYLFRYLTPSYVGVSNYNISQSITYEVEFNFSLTQKAGPGDFYFKFARLNNRTPTSYLTKYCPPYQESELLYNHIGGYNPSEINIGHYDKFNNTYDSFNATLALDETVTFNQKYRVKLNEIKFQDIQDEDIGEYEWNDETFVLYCNHSEPYYERDDPTLISLSNSIVNNGDNPIEKAQKIMEWVSNYLTYNVHPEEKGALWAYNNGEGDCSEYSSLMITLLRIQNIPARKVTGFLISNNPSFQPKINNTYEFQANELGSTILGQAWVEYYVPNIGWIACDPTWHTSVNYFNRIDILRFHWNVGANFFFPPSLTVSEFSNPMFSFTLPSSPEFEYNIKLTVINTSAPSITINSPTDNAVFGKISPDYNLSILGTYEDIWYTIDNGHTNITTNGLIGSINQTEWDKKGNEIVTIKFYAINSAGLIGNANVQVIKLIEEDETQPLIPGYNLVALIGISLIIIKIIYISVNKKNKSKSSSFRTLLLS